MVCCGQQAPDFTLLDSDMKKVSLAEFRGSKKVVLYFYPKDNASGCIREAVDFTDLSDDFEELNTVVLGVNMETCMSHASFRDQHGLTVQLLSDPEGEVCETYGVWQETEKNAGKSRGILRSTFIIDQEGILRHVLYGVKAIGHAANVFELVKKLA